MQQLALVVVYTLYKYQKCPFIDTVTKYHNNDTFKYSSKYVYINHESTTETLCMCTKNIPNSR